MRQFKMKGMAITGYMRYREYFSPTELLQQKEIAAGFFYQHFRLLEDVCKYHVEMFYLTAFMKKEDELLLYFSSFRGYFPVDMVIQNMDVNGISYLRRTLLKQHFQDVKQQKQLKALWELSRKAAALTPGEQNRLFCLLTAGYALAGTTMEQCPITPEEAQNAFLRKSKSEPEGAWLTFSDSGDIRLEARDKPYRVLMKLGARERLHAGACITQRKFVALNHAQSSTGVPVTLHLYTGTEDPNPQVVTIDAGDYCYANFVDTVPVWFHPAVQESATCRVEKMGRRITYTNKLTGQSELLESPAVEPVGFAVEQNAAGWLLMYGGNLSDFAYSRKENDHLHKEDIVQVEFRGDECLLLDRYGTVYTNSGEKYQKQLVSLDEFRR